MSTGSSEHIYDAVPASKNMHSHAAQDNRGRLQQDIPHTLRDHSPVHIPIKADIPCSSDGIHKAH